LQTALPTAQIVQLEKCGHKPWQEINAKDDFYRLVESALN
jgi:hypothetical protein